MDINSQLMFHADVSCMPCSTSTRLDPVRPDTDPFPPLSHYSVTILLDHGSKSKKKPPKILGHEL